MELDKYLRAHVILDEIDRYNDACGFINRLRKEEHRRVFTDVYLDDGRHVGRIPEEILPDLLDILERYYNDKAKELELKFQEL